MKIEDLIIKLQEIQAARVEQKLTVWANYEGDLLVVGEGYEVLEKIDLGS